MILKFKTLKIEIILKVIFINKNNLSKQILYKIFLQITHTVYISIQKHDFTVQNYSSIYHIGSILW